VNEELRNLAQQLASRKYRFQVALDETTDGRPAYAARVVELEGCLGQGGTVEAALADVRAAMADYIHSLLEDGLPVPDPFDELPMSQSVGYRPIERQFRFPKKPEESAGVVKFQETEPPAYISVPA